MEARIQKALDRIASDKLSLQELENLRSNAERIGNADQVIQACNDKISELRKSNVVTRKVVVRGKNSGNDPGLSRKQFMESHGSSCKNWTWSWSFINTEEKFIIFGEWDIYEDAGKTLIFSEDWAISRKGKRQPGYPQSREHIRLIENEGYMLKTFKMIYAPADDLDPGAPAKIIGFEPVLYSRKLIREDNKWFAI